VHLGGGPEAGVPSRLVADALVIKVTAGLDAPERCNQAFTVAATACAAGVPVELWLTGEAAWFALPGRAAELVLEYAAPLPDLLAAVVDAGRVVVCTQCAGRRGINPDDVISGVRIAGASAFIESVMRDGTTSLVY
jgi:predicted peroxiredoxin